MMVADLFWIIGVGLLIAAALMIGFVSSWLFIAAVIVICCLRALGKFINKVLA